VIRGMITLVGLRSEHAPGAAKLSVQPSVHTAAANTAAVRASLLSSLGASQVFHTSLSSK